MTTPTGDDREDITDEALWDFANDLLDAWNIEDTNEPSLSEDFRDRFAARFRCQVSHPEPDKRVDTSPEPVKNVADSLHVLPSHPEPVTDEMVDAGMKADEIAWRQMQVPYMRMRAILKAALAVRLPVPEEGS